MDVWQEWMPMPLKVNRAVPDIEAPADRPEPVTAPLSGNDRATEWDGTAAMNGPDLEAAERQFLLALDELKAWSQEESALRNTILKQAGIKRDSRNAKLQAVFARLKRMGLIETLPGPLGGSWLTPKGRELVVIHRDGRATNAINK